MNDDWRLRVVVSDADQAGQITEALRAHALADEVQRSIHDRVIVSVDGDELFCYAGTREQADHAQEVIARVAAEHAWRPVFELRHWHPTAEQWEDPDTPLPDSDAARAEEQRQRVEQERADSLAQGYPEYEVRVQCGTRGEAVELAERLRSEGLQVVHRWSAVLLGALDEDSAGQLADRLRALAPGSTVTVEGNLRAIYNERPWRPYSVLGGMGG